MKSGKAEVGTQSAKRETVAKRRSMGKGEAETEQAAELADHRVGTQMRDRVRKRETAAERRSMGKGEAEAKEDAEAEQASESADHEKWESRCSDRATKREWLLKGEAWQKEKHRQNKQ